MAINHSQSLSSQTLNTSLENNELKLYKQILTEGKKALQCLSPGCEKIFKYKSDMDRHVLSHTKEKPIVCHYPSCNKNFKRPGALRSHIQIVHVENTVFACPIRGCNYEFQKKSTLQLHLLKHKVIQERAVNASEDDEISLPWKRLVQWEKDWWYKTKNLSAQKPKENEPKNPVWSLKNLFQGLNFLSAFGRSTSQPEKSTSRSLQKNESTSCTPSLIESVLNQPIKEIPQLAKDLCDKVGSLEEK